MNRKMRTVCAWALSVSFVALAGCDTSVNPNFEQALKEQQAQKAGDPYLSLTNNLPKEGNYLRTESALRKAYAGQAALTLRSSYESMLKKLDQDPKVAPAAELLAQCRALFNEVVAFHEDETLDAQKAVTDGATLFDRLNTCRNAALAAGETGKDDIKAATGVLRRFASTGMLIAGLTTIARGNEAPGLGMWRRADALVQEDKPGFKLQPQQFLKN